MGNQPTGGSTMKARVTTIALAILAGTIATNAQQRRQGAAQRQRCPGCTTERGARSRQFNQGRQPRQQGARQQQYRRQARRPQNPQFAQQQRQGQQGFQGRNEQPPQRVSPEQRQRFHEKSLKRFDHDGDGKLSPEERKAAKAMRTKAHKRHGPPTNAE